MLFWAKRGGYTSDLRKAKVFTKEDAESYGRIRPTDIPWPKEYIDSKSRPAVDFQYVNKSGADHYIKSGHILWGQNDTHPPKEICDTHGHVVLSMCKKCGKVEAELFEPCFLKPNNI